MTEDGRCGCKAGCAGAGGAGRMAPYSPPKVSENKFFVFTRIEPEFRRKSFILIKLLADIW